MTQQRVSPVSITSQLPAIPTLSVQGALGQSANLVEVKSSTGSVLTSVTSAGAISSAVGGHTITNTVAGTVPLAITTSASQTADLLSAVYSGSKVFYVNFGGGIRTTAGLKSVSMDAVNGAFAFQTGSASAPVIISRSAASQTANNQEWQDSAGTVLASVSSGGLITSGDNSGNGFKVGSSNFAQLIRVSSTGCLELFSANETLANPGSARGRIYLKTGTNAGTLKLVVRAGAAGAETTILDNIPQ